MARRIKVRVATRKEDLLMYSRKFGIHGMMSAVIALAILGISALVLDRGYLFSAPAGVVQVDQPTPIEALDEVDVIATR
jgi:hypothetical protein